MSQPTWRSALVTGASSGIGEVFARRLAGRGCDLVLVARREDRLRGLADELRWRTGVDVQVLPADLLDGEGLATVERRLSDGTRPVDLLVNNAGFGRRGDVTELTADEQEDQIRLNVVAVVRLTRAVLPGMIERRSGTVLNVSSTASFQPLPSMATYAATKAFVTSFTEALSEELRGTDVRAMALCPGITPTEFGDVAGTKGQERRTPAFLTTSAEQVVDTALADLGRGRVLSVPGLPNVALGWGTSVMPRGVVRRMTGLLARRV